MSSVTTPPTTTAKAAPEKVAKAPPEKVAKESTVCEATGSVPSGTRTR